MPQTPYYVMNEVQQGDDEVGKQEFTTLIEGEESSKGGRGFPLSSPDNNTSTADGPRDIAWAIAFMVNVAVTVISALWFGGTGVKMLSSPDMLLGIRLSEGSSGGGGWSLVLFSGFALVALPWAFLWGLLLALTKYPKTFLQATLLASSGALLAGAIIALVSGLEVVAVIFGVVLIISTIVYFRVVRGHIQFAGENLKVAALAITSMPWTVWSALFMSAFQIIWATVVSIAASGTVYAFETVVAPGETDVYRAADCHNEMAQGATYVSCVCSGELISNYACSYSDPNKFLVLFWLATLIWSGEVVRNVVAATVTGSVASWWYTPHDPSPVKGAFYRATGPSFGSLCKASAVTGAVLFLRWITRRSSRWGRFIDYVLSCIQVAVDYAVAYTVCFIGIYGLSFSEAGSRVGELFLSRGVTTIANDTAVVFVTSSLTVAYVLINLMAILLFFTSDFASNLASGDIGGFIFALFICGFLICRIVISTPLQVVRSGFKAVFVCFTQDPDVLATNHDQQLHADLSRAWQNMQPDECSPGPKTYTMEVELA